MTPEESEQSKWVAWARREYPTITVFHIPNGKKRHISVAKQLKAMGVLAGVADLYCLEYHLFIEFKRAGGRKPRDSQKVFLDKAAASGHRVMVFYGFEDGTLKFTNLAETCKNEKLVTYPVDA